MIFYFFMIVNKMEKKQFVSGGYFEKKAIKKGISIRKFYAYLRSLGIDPVEQMNIGKKIEKEHTSDDSITRQIALDHLIEIPDYYTRLVKMEKEAEDYWKKRKK